ncbi:glutathione-S-transferase [Fomitopsis serialis]|uniref:glutathione-S-transferase n=1 Tax=Fomitopsis serialis TaxID=139415 RepID=UPI002007C587|nr:glutathione-S-transferase [Neoantrodia serialis]KAH9919391.1 glutathione-S-transferase [Neoantrodia serialis]
MGHPDENVYPTATGHALETVKQHEAPQDLVFWAGWFCPFVQRAWIVLEERGIPYQYKEVNPYKKEKHFLDINPKGLVPAVEYKGRALYESLIICEFLEDAYPSHTPHLFPTDPFERAYVRLWVDHVAKNVVPAFHRLLQGQTPEAQAAAREEYYESLRRVSEKAKGPYFLGAEFSMVDVVLAPWVIRDYILRDHRGYSRDAVGSGWKEYAEKLSTRESVLKTQSDLEHYEPIYGRYLRDEAQSEVAKATRAGKGLP